MNKILYFYTVLLLTTSCTNGFRFVRTIEAVGYPYYKILFSLGNCKERLLFSDNKIWGSVRLNRIFDIYYKTDDGATISRVEIKLVMNNTDCVSSTSTGIGQSEFSAVIALPTNVGVIFYSIKIFTCSRVKSDHADSEAEEYTAVGIMTSSESYEEEEE